MAAGRGYTADGTAACGMWWYGVPAAKPRARAAAKQLWVLAGADAPCCHHQAPALSAALLARAAQGNPLETPRSHRAGGALSRPRSPAPPRSDPWTPRCQPTLHFPTRRPRRIYTATSESGAARTLGAPRGKRSRLPPRVAVPSNYKNSRPERAGRTKTTNLI